ncbi:MAG: ATP-binding protein [Sneathiella sp.]|uniref:ATP-binding protein n=1 Tax=Sneathiella sp. TaxID=1964365 RepID=UPI003001E669
MPETGSLKKIGRAVFEMNILDGLADPVILIDEKRNFVDGNQAAFNLVGENVIGKNFSVILKSSEIIEAVDRVLAGQPTENGVAFIPSPVSKTYEMHIMDLSARNPERSGWVMLALHDITSALRSDKMRADFVSNVSHEMRSPLSSLLGFIETLRGPARDDRKAQDRFLGIMENEARRMTRLINDLLTLSQVEADQHIVPDHSVNIQELLKEVINLLSGRAKEQDMTIVLEVSSSLPSVTGDKDELIQVFRNLVDNALNYGTEGTVVTIAASHTRESPPAKISKVLVSVTNQGEGIESKHIPRLTERFYRIDKGRSRATGGTGLGLAIVKHIVYRHRGDLEISSIPGKSSTFAVSLRANG